MQCNSVIFVIDSVDDESHVSERRFFRQRGNKEDQ